MLSIHLFIIIMLSFPNSLFIYLFTYLFILFIHLIEEFDVFIGGLNLTPLQRRMEFCLNLRKTPCSGECFNGSNIGAIEFSSGRMPNTPFYGAD